MKEYFICATDIICFNSDNHWDMEVGFWARCVYQNKKFTSLKHLCKKKKKKVKRKHKQNKTKQNKTKHCHKTKNSPMAFFTSQFSLIAGLNGVKKLMEEKTI